MERFDVLDRKQDLKRNYLLEASAGTGKTFAIENIVVRLLLESDPPVTLEQILVVTFTRAATRDLRIRIRNNIEKVLNALKYRNNDLPDYIIAYLEKDEEAIKNGSKRLEQALYTFDKAQIFTIHSFCSRMLTEHLFDGDIAICSQREQLTDKKIIQVIHDYFRTELRPELFSQAQLSIISQAYSNSTENLENALLKTVKNGLDIECVLSFSEELNAFQQKMLQLKNEYHFKSQLILEDFLLLAPSYEKLCDRSRVVKPENIEYVARFAQLFDKDSWNAADFDIQLMDRLFIVEALDPSRLLKRAKLPKQSELHYPNLMEALRKELWPIISRTSAPLAIFARLAAGCKKMLSRYLAEEELLSFNDLLRTMQQAVQNSKFVEKIRQTFRVAIVDEFQDTDPLQWQIFNTLFLAENDSWGNLYLVGDPKQSIYAFRQADIYTYLDAAQKIGKDNHASLNTNYRSQPSLVHALNALFSAETSARFMPLPRLNSVLDYAQVLPSQKVSEKSFQDELGAVHFCLAESKNHEKSLNQQQIEELYFFPFISKELKRMQKCDGIPFKGCAILVSDRFQAQRLAEYLLTQSIPTTLQRSASLAESPALQALFEIVKATLQPSNESNIKTALGGSLLGWSHTDVHALSDPILMEKVLSQFYFLRFLLVQKGFAAFFQELMHLQFSKNSDPIIVRLLRQASGLSLFEELNQIVHIVLEEENAFKLNPESILEFIEQLSTLDPDEDERIKKRSISDQDAVQILTTHSSKGLEFDIVFALGLATRTKTPNSLIPLIESQNSLDMRLHAVIDKNSDAYHNYCLEIDAEKMRQLYVAMTRAKYRLYVPTILPSEDDIPEEGCGSPMELFLSQLKQPLCQFIESQRSKEVSISYSCLQPTKIKTSEQKETVELPSLIPPHSPKIAGTETYIQSFTSLAKAKQISIKDAPRDFSSVVKNAHTLPSGNHTGTILHTILEKVSFKGVRDSLEPIQVKSLVTPYIEKTPFAEWQETMCELVYHAMHVQLPTKDVGFRLCDIAKESKYQEIEFLYPSEKEGYLKGVIDLVCMHNDKYYLIDWKSNWLGPNRDYYGPEHLERAMREHDYLLQAHIYKDALEKYLKLVDSRPFEDIFGGIYYLFLRGIDSTRSDSSGIYFSMGR